MLLAEVPLTASLPLSLTNGGMAFRNQVDYARTHHRTTFYALEF